MAELLNVDDALQQILSQIPVLASEKIPTSQALGRVLAEDITAGENIPLFANSSMDGYAIRAADVHMARPDNPVRLHVVADIPAGREPTRAVGIQEAARIMTGAVMPEGADAVIPVEQTDDQWTSDGQTSLPEYVAVFRAVGAGDYVRPAGEGIRTGQLVLKSGIVLRPQDIGVLISLGCATISVIRQPRVAILSTGDELIDVNDSLTPGKIRNSNSYVLEGLVTTYGGFPIRLPVARDTVADVRRLFQEALSHQPDLVVSSAGVSVGTHDVVRTVIDELGHVDLWRVNVRPGKPLAYGHVNQIPFFGLPGNPVSTMVTFDIFVRPALLKLGGRPDNLPMTTAVMGENLKSDGRRSYLRVRLTRENGELVARTTGTQSSGVLLSMVLADGLLIVPEGMTDVPAGTHLPVRLLRELET